MIRVGDILHAFVFVVCVAGGGVIAHALGGSTAQGVGYGLVAWIALMLAYLAAARAARASESGAQQSEPTEAPATVDDDPVPGDEDSKRG